ncbi:hypothetical protein AAG906_031550 [Vitis piasezkii]
MKRQRNMVKVPKSRDGENHVKVLKYGVGKTKKRVKEEVGKVEDEKRDDRESMAVALESVVAWEEEPWLSSGVVDEQMSWGLLWFPCWDMEFMGDAYSQLYSDVVWEDDVWNLKSITEIPNP